MVRELYDPPWHPCAARDPKQGSVHKRYPGSVHKCYPHDATREKKRPASHRA